jgi:hypothetical protein
VYNSDKAFPIWASLFTKMYILNFSSIYFSKIIFENRAEYKSCELPCKI